VHLLRGQCFAARQDFSRAEEAFALALEANPDASLDPSRVDPSVVKLLDAMRGRLTGELSLQSTPPGASVSIDGVVAGKAPFTSPVGIGKHKLEARWPDGAVGQADVVVRGKRETRVAFVAVTVTVTVQAPAPPLPPVEPPSRVRPYGELRTGFEVPALNTDWFGLEVGGGVELPWTRFGLTFRMYPAFGLTPRASLVIPVLKDVLLAQVELQVPMLFRQNNFILGFGAVAGVEWTPLKALGVFAQLGGRQYVRGESITFYTRFVSEVGLRIRLP
jgi:PEGA domain